MIILGRPGLLKSHIDTYSRKDGAVVNAHDDKRLAAVPHPNGKHKPGDHVFFPHPKKPGNNALGTYKGHRGGKSVVEHEGAEHDIDHDQIKHARGIPKPADPKASKEAGDHVRAEQEKERQRQQASGEPRKRVFIMGDRVGPS